MTTQHKPSGRASSTAGGLAIGAGVSILATIVICVIGAWLISSEIVDQQHIGYCSLMALLTGAILGAMTAWKKIRRQKWIVCLMSGGVFFALLSMVTIVFFNGDFQGMGITLFAILMGSLAAAFLANGQRKQKIGKRRKKIRT